MPSSSARAQAAFAVLALSSVIAPSLSCTGAAERPLLPRSQTWAELRTVRRGVMVAPPGEAQRAPYPRERLVDGEAITVAPEGLAWLRRDGGATLLVHGPAQITLRSDGIDVTEGRLFIDTPAGLTAELTTPNGPLHLAHVRASLEVSAAKATTEAYVLAGEVRTDGTARAAAGERLVVSGKGTEAKGTAAPALTWDDWTGGLATTDRAAEPSPYGVGTVGARGAGEQGAPRFPLAIQRLDVKVSVEQDFAITEVDEVFFNPSSEVVEGVYRFRTPDGASLHRFGVDRDGVVVWGRVKEKAAAAAQYQSNVYAGSTEDPALLEWDAPGVYRARLYPIGPGETRRVVVRYAEWLGRSGAKSERRLYVYPMAAEGAEASLPHIEELSATIDLSRAGAKDVRCGMAGTREGDSLIVREHDLVPRADLAVELFDDGPKELRAYTAPHSVDVETLFPAERPEALKRARDEAAYLLVPVRGAAIPAQPGGLDLAIIVDTSAATDRASLAIARAATTALLAHVGADDRVVVWAGDAGLRPILPGVAKPAALGDAARRDVLTRLAAVERGGATDLGAMLADAAAALDPARRSAIVYIGDGSPTVGELALVDVKARLAKLPHPVRIFGLGVGDDADMAMLKGLARGAFAERIGDANAAARAALRLLESADRPALLGATIDLGPSVERVFPRDLGAIVEGESFLVIGRLTGQGRPTTLTIDGAGGTSKLPLTILGVDDRGDLRHRWAEGRLAQMMDEGTGRAAMVDLGSRHGIITPFTSLYVPTRREMSPEELSELAQARSAQREHWTRQPSKYRAPTAADREREEEDKPVEQVADNSADSKEGGTGTRAKGEEGSMGNPNSRATGNRYGVQGPRDSAASPQFFGASKSAAAAAPVAVAASAPPPPPAQAMAAPSVAMAAPPAATATAALALRRAALDGAKDTVAKPAPDLLPTTPAPVGRPQTIDNEGRFDGKDGDGWIAGDVGGKNDLPDVGVNGTFDWSANVGQGFGAGAVGRLGGNHRAKVDAQEVDKSGVSAGPTTAFRQRVIVDVAEVPHFAIRCGAAAFVPFEEKVQLWQERLARVVGNAPGVAAVYRRALGACEAPTWRERSKLLALLLDSMPGIPGKVALWRTMFADFGAADPLYRSIVARVKTPAEARALHDALGLKVIDPGILAKLLKDAKSPVDRAAKLRALALEWPDDFTLALKLLDALEDAADDDGARVLAKTLRARPDADARVRTAVGELYLRLGARAPTPELKVESEIEARRAFGEIVEFSPDDPIARRRLGDLLRAHGLYADAARQYETLARLAPDDAGVPLLLAAAAEGLGKLEEAVKWTEKGGAVGAPDTEQSPARTARAFAATYLAWGRLAAIEAGHKDEAAALGARLARVLASEHSGNAALRGTRVALTWAHPELHPTLWSNALGAPMPAPEGDVTLGVAEALVPKREGAFVEVRLEPDDVEHAARLGATATLTVVFDEGGEGEKIVKVPVRFSRDGAPTLRFSLAGGEVREVKP
jgi:Ca-activated chloride channel family protein